MTFFADNMYCGALKRGDIVMYEIDGEQRPALVLQDDVLNGGLPSVVCARLTVQKPKSQPVVTEVAIHKTSSGLGKNTLCQLHHIHTIERHIIRAKKGEVGSEILQEIFDALDISLGRFRDRG